MVYVKPIKEMFAYQTCFNIIKLYKLKTDHHQFAHWNSLTIARVKILGFHYQQIFTWFQKKISCISPYFIICVSFQLKIFICFLNNIQMQHAAFLLSIQMKHMMMFHACVLNQLYIQKFLWLLTSRLYRWTFKRTYGNRLLRNLG